MYAELLCRSNFSFLRGASHPEELVTEAQALGLAALGLADRDGVYGLARAWGKAREMPGFKFICGAELSLEGGAGLSLLAKNKAGWSLLCRLITASHAGQPKGEARLSFAELLSQTEESPGRMGLLCLPRGEGLGERFPEEAYGIVMDLFGEDLFIPVARHMDGQGRARSLAVKERCRSLGALPLAVNDVHYHHASRRPLQDALACIRHGVALPEAGHRLFSNAERRLKSPAEMGQLFRDWIAPLDNSLDAAERCSFQLSELRYRYPSEWIPRGLSSQEYLEALCKEGMATRYPAGPPQAVSAQLAHEMGLIAQLGFADYFLTIHEMVDFARGRGILCQGRGSAANSVVCYLLGITSIDPVRMGLLFERFLSMERAEPPDIDVDFEHERREEVIQHMYERYGRDRAAMVSAVISYRSRSAIADLSKALGEPVRAKASLRDIDIRDYGPRVSALAEELKGFPRHLSIHSGGFVLSDGPLIDLVPIEPARMEKRSIVQWDKYDLDTIGLMKVDVLALGMLSALRRGMDMIGAKELGDLPSEDPATYAMIQKGDTIGVFQIESRAQMNMLGRLKPANFYDLVIEVAIVRPGPIVGKMVHPYLRRRRGQEPVEYEHPALEKILSKTLGVPLFQEQVMRIAVDLAGFSPGQADELRRAIGAWRSNGRLDLIAGRLMAGLRAQGLSEEFCGRLFNEIKGFADYGFPESHAASFALLCYASSYLKCHHPAEFCCALINSQPMGFYSSHSLVDDAKLHGVLVQPIHPNESNWDCEVRQGELHLGWRVTSGLSVEDAHRLESQRPFRDLDDFALRSRLQGRVLRRLALGDAFACFGLNSRDALWRVLVLEAFGGLGAPQQASLFSWAGTAEDGRLPQGLRVAESAASFEAPGLWDAVTEEYKTFGLSTKAHPMQALRKILRLSETRCADARKAQHGAWFSCAGFLIVRQRPGDGKVIFATLEDESGLIDLALFLDVYQRYRDEFLENRFFEAGGILQKDGDSVSLLLKKLRVLTPGEPLRADSHNWR
jgi:error-prone DNA polymerase